MGLLTIFRDPWKLETLRDFWRVGRWMQAQRRRGQADQALRRYLQRMSGLLVAAVKRYRGLAEALDSASSRLLRISPGPRAEEKNAQISLLAHIQDRSGRLSERLGKLLALPDKSLLPQWDKLLSDTRSFNGLLNAIVHDLGCFEQVLHVLPGTGHVICRPTVQACLSEMFAINMRNVRLLEFIQPIWTAWRGGGGESMGFFRGQSDCNQMLRSMLLQYMVEADPDRVHVRRQQAAYANRRFVPFRFWRPAECLRQLAGLTYVGAEATPRPTRAYVDIRAQRVPHTWADQDRLDWALREIFNNSVAATSRMFMNDGQIVVRPLEKHAQGPVSPVVSLHLDVVQSGRWPWRRQALRITVADRGVGIERDNLGKAMLWGFSTKRDRHRLEPADEEDGEPMLIGGKGMGLPFAQWVLAEHGGRLTLDSAEGEGTRVVMELPLGFFA